jgi:predicted Zn-dependent protease
VASVQSLLALLERGMDSPLLRYSLAGEMHRQNDPVGALPHALKAVRMQPDFSAAWKLLGKIQAESGDTAMAMEAYSKGIQVAKAQGDKQAEKEMQVFLKRLQRDV